MQPLGGIQSAYVNPDSILSLIMALGRAAGARGESLTPGPFPPPRLQMKEKSGGGGGMGGLGGLMGGGQKSKTEAPIGHGPGFGTALMEQYDPVSHTGGMSMGGFSDRLRSGDTYEMASSGLLDFGSFFGPSGIEPYAFPGSTYPIFGAGLAF